MKKYLYIILLIILSASSNTIFASDVIINGVNLGECKSYFDGCNNCNVGSDGQAACTMMACEKNGTPKCLDTIDDNQLIEIENPENTKELSVNFKLEKFNSCSDFTSKVKQYIKDYYEIYPNGGGYYRGGMVDDVMIMEESAAPTAGVAKSSNIASDSSKDSTEVAGDYSKTNIQVTGVDESEIVKTDGKYIYYYNSSEHAIFVVKSLPSKDMKIMKKIKVPSNFSSPEIYIENSKLIIISNKYLEGNYSYYWYDRTQKTSVIIYDIKDLNSLKLEKYYQVDGNVTKSRKIGKYLYILSQSSLYFPYNNYYGPLMKAETLKLDETKLNTDLSEKRLIPKKVELRITEDLKEKNVNIKGTKNSYNLKNDYTAKCSDIEYVMPDKETLKKFIFNPSYTTLSIIDTEDTSKEIKTKLLFGDVNEIYMSLDNLYITSNLYTSYNFRCPEIKCIKAPCISSCAMPYYNRGENTLIHKFNINGDSLKYQTSNIIPGNPLTQYSMDEKDSNFRIVTSSNTPNVSTNLYILDKDLKIKGKLENLAKDERFQSSRFIQDKLYLVTFKQIDPLFVIDLKDSLNPKVLGELKIPGYSTYLHPYDENHLIGLGYNTKENKWGGTVNDGLKIDLYDISDFKNPKQKYSLTIGEQGSYSEVLNNPRLFVWNSKQNILLMPANTYKSANDANNPYRYSDAFQGAYAIKIDKDSGIKKLAEITHIDRTGLDEKRKLECEKYTKIETPKCEKLLNGQEYCPPVNTYVPEYCYASSSIGEYFANNIWNFNNDFITRNLYLDNIWYTISNTKIQANDMNSNFEKVSEVNMK